MWFLKKLGCVQRRRKLSLVTCVGCGVGLSAYFTVKVIGSCLCVTANGVVFFLYFLCGGDGIEHNLFAILKSTICICLGWFL